MFLILNSLQIILPYKLLNLPNYIKCGEWKLTNEKLSKVVNYNIN